jgi:hypothetical protein
VAVLWQACQEPTAMSLAEATHSGSRLMTQHTSAYVSIRQHTSAYVSIRQHTSAYVSIRQHTSDLRSPLTLSPVGAEPDKLEVAVRQSVTPPPPPGALHAPLSKPRERTAAHRFSSWMCSFDRIIAIRNCSSSPSSISAGVLTRRVAV